MDDERRTEGTREATRSPTEGDRMDEGIHQARGRSETTISPPAGLENDVPIVDVHGAPAPKPDIEDTMDEARTGVERAFESADDSAGDGSGDATGD